MLILKNKDKSKPLATTVCDISVEVSQSGVSIESPDEVCFVPKKHIASIVFVKKPRRLEIYNVNKEGTLTLSRYPGVEDLYHKILNILNE